MNHEVLFTFPFLFLFYYNGPGFVCFSFWLFGVVSHIVSLFLMLFPFFRLLVRLYVGSFSHSPLFLLTFCLVCVFMLFVILVLFIVFCVSGSCAVLVTGRSHSLFRFSLFLKPMSTVSFADLCFCHSARPASWLSFTCRWLYSFFPVLLSVVLVCVVSVCVALTASDVLHFFLVFLFYPISR